MSKSQAKYIGYKEIDRATPLAKFYREEVAPIPTYVEKALIASPFPTGTFPSFENVSYLLSKGYKEAEIGYSLEKEGLAHVAILTNMPKVQPKMWDWWFAWHGSQDNRYKLWHPKAHRSAQWADGKTDILKYIGRTSLISEYIGKRLETASIRFVAPSELGLANSEKEVFICARVGYTRLPVDFGWLVHQIRSTENGAEMRSRFWLGGKYIEVRGKNVFSKLLSRLLPKLIRASKQQAIDILTHCSEEMNHLAAILPDLYKEFSSLHSR